jgi:hypothetical protein
MSVSVSMRRSRKRQDAGAEAEAEILVSDKQNGRHHAKASPISKLVQSVTLRAAAAASARQRGEVIGSVSRQVDGRDAALR